MRPNPHRDEKSRAPGNASRLWQPDGPRSERGGKSLLVRPGRSQPRPLGCCARGDRRSGRRRKPSSGAGQRNANTNESGMSATTKVSHSEIANSLTLCPNLQDHPKRRGRPHAARHCRPEFMPGADSERVNWRSGPSMTPGHDDAFPSPDRAPLAAGHASSSRRRCFRRYPCFFEPPDGGWFLNEA